jgi:hypothetical protein
MPTETMGSQRLLQVAVNRKPELLRGALRRSGALGKREEITWVSPLRDDGYREYRDGVAMARLGLTGRLQTPLSEFWPPRGPVWDGLAIAGGVRPLLVEAKAHIPEMVVSGGTRATRTSLDKIKKSLERALRPLNRGSRGDWTGCFFQYANRVAHQIFLRKLNGIASSLVFLYFTNATDMDGPATEEEWEGSVRLIHAALGLPKDLSPAGVFHAYLDARLLTDAR